MIAAKVLCSLLLLSSAWHAVVAQPTNIEPILPPIPDPPYPHSVRFCGIANNASFSLNASTLDQCDWKKYGMSYLPFVGGPIALIAVALVISIILPIVLCVACCKRPTVHFLCRLMLLILFGALLAAGFILIYVGNAKTSTVVNALEVTISGTLGTAIDRLDQAQALASQLPYTNDSTTAQTFADARATLVGFQSDTVTVSEKVNKYDGIRKAAIFVGSLVPLALTIGGALFMIFNCGKPAMGAVAWFLVFLSILAWLCMGAHLVIGKGLSDVCYEVDLAQAEGETGVLGIIIKCQQNTSELEDVRTAINDGINQATDSACSAMNSTCTTSTPAGPVDCEPAPWVCSQSNIDTYPNFTMTDVATSCDDGTFVVPGDSCASPATANGTYTNSLEVKDCPTDCKNPEFRSRAAQAIDGLATLNQYYTVAAEVQPLLTCDFVADAFWSAKVTICTTFDRALTLIFVGAGLEAAGMGLAMAALVHCFMGLAGGKRDVFNPRDTL